MATAEGSVAGRRSGYNRSRATTVSRRSPRSRSPERTAGRLTMIGRVEDIFDPSHYSKVSLPLEEAEALPRWCFTSEEFYQREIERIFLRSWMFVGRAEEAANPGDYFTIDIAGEPLIIMRDSAGTLHALANTCQHRGARLLAGK